MSKQYLDEDFQNCGVSDSDYKGLDNLFWIGDFMRPLPPDNLNFGKLLSLQVPTK